MNKETAATQGKEEPTPSKKLAECDFELTESLQQFQTAMPPAGTTRKDVLNPVFWTHIAKRLEPMAEIRIMPKDGSWYGIYLVTFCDKVQVQLQELQYHEIETVKDVSADLFVIKWMGPAIKFCVIRKEDKERISEDHATKQSAVLWMRDNAK